MRPLILTQGDPEGIGPELLLAVAAQGHLGPKDHVVANPAVLEGMADRVATPWARDGLAALEALLVPNENPSQVAVLERAVDLVLASPGAALVTAPLDKARAVAEGFSFPGHTEYLAARAQTEDFCMAMLGPVLRVALATIHIPLREVPTKLDAARIERPARLLAEACARQFGITHPRIGILGLNPHAGESGVLGHEDAETIAPAVEELQRWGDGRFTFSGPLPADTAFALHVQGKLDALVAMYHDQGLAPFKLMHFADGVNATLGLPFVRTSPDHGTARDIAGQGIADPSSMIAAIRMARSGAAHGKVE